MVSWQIYNLFWVIITILIPFAVLVAGLFARIGLPKRVNWIVGYRTFMSMKNKETWVFAHKYVGKWWTICGIFFIIVAFVGMIIIELEILTLEPAIFVAIVAIAALVILVIALIFTEIALRKEFDKNGKRRQ